MRRLIARGGWVTLWLLVIALLALWLVEAVHRGHAPGIFIVAVALAATVIVPLLTSRLRS